MLEWLLGGFVKESSAFVRKFVAREKVETEFWTEFI